MSRKDKETMDYICKTPDLLSLLYDLDLLPEQLQEGSNDFDRMIILSEWHKRTFEKKP